MPVESGRPRNRSFISNNEGAFTLNGAPFYNDAGVDISGTFDLQERAGNYTVTAGDATANAAVIATGLTTITTAIVQVTSSAGAVLTSDAVVTFSSGNLTVGDGSTYNTVAGNLIRWIAYGV